MQATAPAHRLSWARPRSGALVDVVITGLALAASLALLFHGGVGARHSSQLNAFSATLVACATLPLLAWRRAPLAVLGLTAAASILAAGLGYALDIPFGPTAALYLLAARRHDTRPWTPRATTLTVGLFVSYLAMTAVGKGAFPAIELFHTGLAWSVAWFAGERAWLRRQQIAELEQRAIQAERETERERRLAKAEERARIARDLHDSAGHAISVIALRAGTARLRHDEDPDRSRLALEAIEQLARQTAGEIDQIVGTLRDNRASRTIVEAPPGLASLDSLLERHVAAGLDVSIVTAGAPRTLGGAVDQATFRILQEALTNAARHGSGSAQVNLLYDETGVELTVANPVLANAGATSTGGHGLVGMHERATLLGGSLQAERVNGTFRLHARLPHCAHRA